MPPIVVRPENVLKRADELVGMEKQSAALDMLYETLLSKRTRALSVPNLEPVVQRFAELAVQQRKGKVLKDGLHQYKKLVTPTNSTALIAVIEHLLELSEKRVGEAQQAADELIDDDLEAEQTPQDLLMATVSSEQTKDRTDREVVTPWLKFLWEGYRTVLDVLRNNSQLETQYAQVTRRAFQFCLRYGRKTEFRRLCEMLRTHLSYAARGGSTVPNQINLNDPQTLQRFLDTRFEQLTVAVKLELWQEAFRSVEDVHTLLTASRHPIRISNKATYYETLAKVFAVSNNYLYHAAAWSKYYSMVYNARHSAPEGELQRIASFFLLSVLCISDKDTSEESPRAHRWASLLNLGQVPKRSELLEQALAKNVLMYARPEICRLYEVLSHFNVLELNKKLGPVSAEIAKVKSYQSYIKPLFHVLASRIFTQISELYTEARLSFVIELATLPAPFTASPLEIEKLLVSGSHHVRIDHATGSVVFQEALDGVSPVGDLVRNQLSSLHSCLSEVLPEIDSKSKKIADNRAQALSQAVKSGFAIENSTFLRNKETERARAEKRAKEQQAAESQEARERHENALREQAAAAARQANEAREREIKRIEREQKAAEMEIKRRLAEDINAKGIVHVDMNGLDKMSQRDLLEMQVQQLAKESKDLRSAMRSVARRQDHLIRAWRREEAKLWSQEVEQQEGWDREAYEARKRALLTGARSRYDHAVQARERLTRLSSPFHAFLAEIKTENSERVASEEKRQAELLGAAKAKRIEEHEEKIRKEQQQREEREARLKEEREAAAKREAEEKERLAQTSRNKFVPSSIRQEHELPPPSAKPSPFGAARPAATNDVKPAPAASPFGGAKPVATKDPFGGARPVPTKDPFGGAKPTATKDPFGGAKPAPTRDPFGGAKPAPTKDPFGGAKPAPTKDPFGGARPVPTKDPFGGAKPVPTKDPFGGAKPVPTKDPFGNAKPVDKKPQSKWVPPNRR